MSEFKPELPPRLTFHGDIIKAQQSAWAFTQEQLGLTPEEMATAFGPGDETADTFSSVYGDGSTPSRRVPLGIIGADQVAFESVFSSGRDSETREIKLKLFQDGSPYVPETLRSDDNTFVVIAAPEMPPAMVHTLHQEAWAKSDPRHGGGDGIGMIAFVRQKFGPQAVHELTDEECHQIITGLEAVQPDINMDVNREILEDPEGLS